MPRESTMTGARDDQHITPQRGVKPNRWVAPIGGKSTTRVKPNRWVAPIGGKYTIKRGFIIQSVGGTNLEWRIASTQGGRLHGRDGHASGKHHDGR
jgi:hypothetical protein